VRVGKYQTREDAKQSARTFYEKEKIPYWITAASLDAAEAPATANAASKAQRTAEPSPQELSSAGSEKKAPDATVTAPAAASIYPSSGWPPVVTHIYTYYDAQGYLRITNSAEKFLASHKRK
jgi:hypothetical protein